MKTDTIIDKDAEGKIQMKRYTLKTRGLVESLQDGIMELPAGARVTEHEIMCTYLSIRTNEGVDKVEWPERFSPPEMNALLGQTIDYERKQTTYPIPISHGQFANHWDNRIELLGGQYKEWKLEKRISFATMGCILE